MPAHWNQLHCSRYEHCGTQLQCADRDELPTSDCPLQPAAPHSWCQQWENTDPGHSVFGGTRNAPGLLCSAASCSTTVPSREERRSGMPPVTNGAAEGEGARAVRLWRTPPPRHQTCVSRLRLGCDATRKSFPQQIIKKCRRTPSSLGSFVSTCLPRSTHLLSLHKIASPSASLHRRIRKRPRPHWNPTRDGRASTLQPFSAMGAPPAMPKARRTHTATASKTKSMRAVRPVWCGPGRTRTAVS